MSGFETIEIERDARGVATLWLAREAKHNAMSAQMIAELHAAADQLGADDSVRVVVLAARGPSFCAGGDLGWMRQQFEATPEVRKAEAGTLAHMLQALNTLSKPLIGRVQGNAFGGGVGLASVCDVAIGADSVLMGLTETRLGLIPATIGPYVCARMGEARARRVFMSARRFGAAEAVELGLLARAVPAEELDAAIEAEVAPYLDCAPGAVARAKALLRTLGPQIDDAVISHTIDQLAECWQGTEAPEGIGAFFDKRKPSWQSQG
ncbi:crotonase/enoyl-CoA hydratase family protein [Phaeobacter sp. CNT1-3]|nr:crotonase/enoyl-CoA hydratase family protein [Phaeobacter sp. CNT1-3]